MNQKLVESLVQVILSLSEEERSLLCKKINLATASPSIKDEVSDLENRLKNFEVRYQMSSDKFYRLFQNGELGDAIDFFEWSVFYEMWTTAKNQSEPLPSQN